MKIKWQWFLGGDFMFWASIAVFVVLIVIFVFTYVIDLSTLIAMKVQRIDAVSIEEISKKYMSDLRYNCR